jgi:L-rhamnonate dehydratase
VQHVIRRVEATALLVKSDMSWLGLSRSRLSSMCLVEVETDSGLIGHGLTNLADGAVVAQAVNGVLAPIAIGNSALATEKVWGAMWWAPCGGV